MQILLWNSSLARLVPCVVGAIVLVAGALQFSAWKARRLACCRMPPASECRASANVRDAWQHGLRLGLRCIGCCANLTAVLLVAGVMDLRMMALATMAIGTERLPADGGYAARVVGAVEVGAGVSLVMLSVPAAMR